MEMIHEQNSKIDQLYEANKGLSGKVKRLERQLERNERDYNANIKRMRLENQILGNKLENVCKAISGDSMEKSGKGNRGQRGKIKNSYDSSLKSLEKEARVVKKVKKRKMSSNKGKYLSGSRPVN